MTQPASIHTFSLGKRYQLLASASHPKTHPAFRLEIRPHMPALKKISRGPLSKRNNESIWKLQTKSNFESNSESYCMILDPWPYIYITIQLWRCDTSQAGCCDAQGPWGEIRKGFTASRTRSRHIPGLPWPPGWDLMDRDPSKLNMPPLKNDRW